MKPILAAAGALFFLLGTSLPAAAEESGDAERGATLYHQRCVGCHSLDANRVGPQHRGVYGRQPASVADYQYSAALRRLKDPWIDETLDRWLANPTAMAPGTAMGFRVPQVRDRADIIAYLRSLTAR
ncbi:MAG: c-type cytochrome [Alphaproteobacteria bacterium]|nr:c-type cytochrome [Alphaproteobacteria bacterium]MCW5741656.1 c-type cytochrome [Alphaproteobacteria bacterium]